MVTVVVVALAAVFLVRQTLADRYRIDGQSALASNAAEALGDANRAIALDGDLLPAWYLKASAYARFGDYAASRAALAAATRRGPHEWVTWALLGDLAVRGRDLALTRVAYGRAHALNPRDAELARRARNPAG